MKAVAVHPGKPGSVVNLAAVALDLPERSLSTMETGTAWPASVG